MITVTLSDGRTCSIYEYLAEAKKHVDLAKGLGQKIADAKSGVATLTESIAEHRESLSDLQTAMQSFYVNEPLEAASEVELANGPLEFDREKARQSIIQLLENEE